MENKQDMIAGLLYTIYRYETQLEAFKQYDSDTFLFKKAVDECERIIKEKKEELKKLTNKSN